MSLSALPTAQFATIAPAGFRILAALEAASRLCKVDLVITSGTDGLHSGPQDPHHLGCAYDVRSHDFDFAAKVNVLHATMQQLIDSGGVEGTPLEVDGGLRTDKFFGWLEAAGTAVEHFHFQLRHGVSYP